MKKNSIFVDTSLLKTNSNFRMVFIARLFSILALGMLTVAVPMQVHQLTGSSFQVGVILALDGLGMLIGLLIGGVLADRYERRKLILTGRFACALGFSALAINCYFASPSLLALYLLSLWSGFFGAIGITALMASIPMLVGRANLAQAGALSMLTVRIGTVISPLIGGAIIAASDISWNYTAAALGTFATLIPLRRLPIMPAINAQTESALNAFSDGFKFIFNKKIIFEATLIGMLDAMGKGIRVLFPALAMAQVGGGSFELGLLFSAVPLGATLFAFTSGPIANLTHPRRVMLLSSGLAFASLSVLALATPFWLILTVLVIYGYLSSISALLQYTQIQAHTPNHLLGRTNSLWTAQNVSGDALGALIMGGVSKLLSPVMSLMLLSTMASCGVAAVWAVSASGLKHSSEHSPENSSEIEGNTQKEAAKLAP
jgi:ENTS family enterobactin (siderophore) exporter